jgi:hypothetical protein
MSKDLPTGRSCYVAALRQELIARNRSYASLNRLPHVTSYGELPVVVYQQSSSWRRLLMHPAKHLAVLAVVRNSIGSMVTALAHPSLTLKRGAHPTSLAADFGRLANRGVDSLLLYSKSGPDYEYLQAQWGKEIQDLVSKGLLRIAVFENANHTFMESEAKRRLLDVLEKDLVRRLRTFHDNGEGARMLSKWVAEVIFRFAHEPVAVAVPR